MATTLKRAKGGQFAMHAKALPGNPGACPWVGRRPNPTGTRLRPIIPDIEHMIGNELERVLGDAGYKRSQRAAKPQVQDLHRRTEAKNDAGHQARDETKARAIEPVIGHIKNEHRMGRNYFAHQARRRDQRHSRCRRLQLPSPPQLAFPGPRQNRTKNGKTFFQSAPTSRPSSSTG